MTKITTRIGPFEAYWNHRRYVSSTNTLTIRGIRHEEMDRWIRSAGRAGDDYGGVR